MYGKPMGHPHSPPVTQLGTPHARQPSSPSTPEFGGNAHAQRSMHATGPPQYTSAHIDAHVHSSGWSATSFPPTETISTSSRPMWSRISRSWASSRVHARSLRLVASIAVFTAASGAARPALPRSAINLFNQYVTSAFMIGGRKMDSYPFTASWLSLNHTLLSSDESPAVQTRCLPCARSVWTTSSRSRTGWPKYSP